LLLLNWDKPHIPPRKRLSSSAHREIYRGTNHRAIRRFKLIFLPTSLPGRFAGIRRPLRVCGDEMRHHRRLLADVERPGAIFGDPVAHGHALVLTQMFGPGFDYESFEVTARVGGIGLQTRA